MTAYYNEIDPFCAEWLRRLIRRGLIADGIVDDRSISDVHPVDLRGFTQCHFFAGIGVWSYALRQAGWPDSRPVWTGSCPCQPFSLAGKRKGFDDERHLWPAWFGLIRECRPDIVLGEQVSGKGGLAWFDVVQADLENAGYAVGAVDAPAACVGAPHIRQRLWIVALRVADTDGAQCGWDQGAPKPAGRDVTTDRSTTGRVADANGAGLQQGCWATETARHRRPLDATRIPDQYGPSTPTGGFWRNADWLRCRDGKWRPVEPGSFPLADGPPARVGRLRAYGNAIVAPAAQAFIETVMGVIDDGQGNVHQNSNGH